MSATAELERVVTTVELPITVAREEVVRQVVSAGSQGPRGATGAAGASGGETLTITAAAALSGHRAIALNAAGDAIYADASDSTAFRALGVSTGAAILGDPLTVRQLGAMEWPAGGLTPDVPLYLGASGALSHTPPATGYVRQIAVALDTNRIQVGLGPLIKQE